jgi:hypothetical protein
MNTLILTNKEGELYVWQKPSVEQKKLLKVYREECERAKAEAVKVVNADVQCSVHGLNHDIITVNIDGCIELKNGEDLPLPEGLEVEIDWVNPCIKAKMCLIADQPGNKNNCNQLRHSTCQKEHKVARIITKPVDSDKIFIDGDFNDSYESRVRRAKGKRIEGLSNEKFDVHQVDSQNVEFSPKVEPIKEESQEEIMREMVRTAFVKWPDKYIVTRR